MDTDFANHPPMDPTGNKTEEPFPAGLACISESVEPICLIRMGGEQTAHTSAKRCPKYPECQLQQSRSVMQDWKYVDREKVSIKFCYISMNCYLGNWRKSDIIK